MIKIVILHFLSIFFIGCVATPKLSPQGGRTPAQIDNPFDNSYVKDSVELDVVFISLLDQASGNFPIRECDVIPVEQCRTDRILIFRGESGLWDTSGLSPLARSHIGGSDFCKECNPNDLLKTLISAVDNLLYRSGLYPGERDGVQPVYLHRVNGVDTWKTFDGNSLKSENVKSSENWNSNKLIVGYHFLGAGMRYVSRDSRKGSDMSPLISFSYSPWIGLSFSIQDKWQEPFKGRLIVLSVPQGRIVRDCNQAFGPGLIIDPTQCYKSAGEAELDSILVINPEYLLKSFIISNKFIGVVKPMLEKHQRWLKSDN